MTDSNIIDRLNALLKSDKPKIIADRFKDVSELTEQQIRHFKNAEYAWNLNPNNDEGSYKGMHLGVLLDEKINYVHLVFVSINFINQINGGKRLNNQEKK
jgi:hypothetical protein